jgi:hypothetical protein
VQGQSGIQQTKKVCLIGRRTKRRAMDCLLLLDLRHKIFQPVHAVVRRLLLLHNHRSHPDRAAEEPVDPQKFCCD